MMLQFETDRLPRCRARYTGFRPQRRGGHVACTELPRAAYAETRTRPRDRITR